MKTKQIVVKINKFRWCRFDKKSDCLWVQHKLARLIAKTITTVIRNDKPIGIQTDPISGYPLSQQLNYSKIII